MIETSKIIAIVLAKRPEPGLVKTRLARNGAVDPEAAAAVAAAMLRCTVRRLEAVFDDVRLAVTPDGCGEEVANRLGVGVGVLDQGPGDLGARLDRLWRTVGAGRPIAFFGTDCPDVPTDALTAIGRHLGAADLAIGPTDDGGFWTLAARRHQPGLLTGGIDWGTATVYHQVCERAGSNGLSTSALPTWRDVDEPQDVEALIGRLHDRLRAASRAGDDPLRILAGDLEAIWTARALPRRRTGLLGVDTSVNEMPVHHDATELDVELGEATILLVDDNQQNLELMQAYLEAMPCRILTATDGVEAAEVIDREAPDLVLLDVMMPRMSGFELCQKLKSTPPTRDTVVIMVTALHEVGDFERAVECGTDDFLTKPVNKLELITRVKSLLRVRLLKRKLDQVLALKQHDER